MVKTIKELAEEFGVSKQAVRKSVDRLIPTNYKLGINNKIEVDTEGYNILKDYYRKNINQNIDVAANLPPTIDNQVVDILKHELELSHEKNKHQQEQIDNLQKLLENQQVLTLQAQERVQLLETQKAEMDIIEKEQKNKWKFWK